MRDFLAIYCERAGLSGFFAEPLNLVTNAAFLIAAYLAWRRFQDGTAGPFRKTWDIVLLIVLVFLIGLGSAAWHAVPIRATLAADVIPITIFIHVYLVVFARRILQLSWLETGLLFAVYVGGSVLLVNVFPRNAFNGSVGYLPGLLMMAIITAVLFLQNRHARWGLLSATLVFAVSLTARTGDRAVCEVFPIGTHFVWHSLNAVVLYLLVMIVVRQSAQLGDYDPDTHDAVFGKRPDAVAHDAGQKKE